jgi:uracil-DNA glycosylase
VSDGRALARAYLDQQRLLGGDTVVLPEAAGPRPPVAAERADTTPPPEPAQGPERAEALGTARAPLEPTPSEQDPVVPPPPGITYDPPPGDLFATDPVARAPSLDVLADLVRVCTRCQLCEGRTHAVPGEGPSDARLVVVGEGPGRTEDETGRPFVGKAGELLTRILASIALPREQVFICNVVKCRPPENRPPLYDEIAACLPYLHRQIELLHPKLILAMGGTAAQSLLDTRQSLGALRNRLHRFRGIPVLVTYHPAALLRNPNWKRPTWDDVRIARRLLD